MVCVEGEKIFIDGVKAGTCPMAAIALTPGPHKIAVRGGEEAPARWTITIAEGERLTVDPRAQTQAPAAGEPPAEEEEAPPPESP